VVDQFLRSFGCWVRLGHGGHREGDPGKANTIGRPGGEGC
jgi:hypothetical protein